MAPSPKLISFLFLLTLFSMKLIHARESQFFSKFNNNNPQETTLINTQEQNPTTYTTQKVSFPNKEQEQEPSFIPQTQNGYGLYGHESGQLPPSTTTTNNNNNYQYNNKNGFDENEQQNLGDTKFTEKGYTTSNMANNNYYYNKDGYENEQQNLGDTKFTEKGYATNNNYYNKNAYDQNEQQNLGETSFTEKGYTTTTNMANNYNGRNNRYNNNVEKQGMSDTRFMENGKYYYDINDENKYYNKNNQYQSSRASVVSRNDQYNTEGYYGNYNNVNANNYNSMEGNQNQEEFQENQEEYVP